MTTLVFCAMWCWSTGYGMDTIHSICHRQRLWKALALYAGHFGPGLLIGIWWQSKTDCPDCHLWRVEGAGKQETKCFETFLQICGWSFGLTCFCSDFLEISSTFPRHSLDIFLDIYVIEMSILNFRLNIFLLLFFWSQAIPILASMLGTSQSADDEVGITVQWLPSGDTKMTVDTMVFPHLSNTLQKRCWTWCMRNMSGS